MKNKEPKHSPPHINSSSTKVTSQVKGATVSRYAGVKQDGKADKPRVIADTVSSMSVLESYEDVSPEGVSTLSLIQTVREGVGFPLFEKISTETSFSTAEWSTYLHVSERTMQRYKKQNGSFEPPQSEKILEIMLLVRKGEEVFGDKRKFNAWLNATNVSLGNVVPKNLLDSSFGINLLKDELIRIEYGVFA